MRSTPVYQIRVVVHPEYPSALESHPMPDHASAAAAEIQNRFDRSDVHSVRMQQTFDIAGALKPMIVEVLGVFVGDRQTNHLRRGQWKSVRCSCITKRGVEGPL